MEQTAPAAVVTRNRGRPVRCECCDERIRTGIRGYRIARLAVGDQPNSGEFKAWLCEGCGNKVMRAINRAAVGVAS